MVRVEGCAVRFVTFDEFVAPASVPAQKETEWKGAFEPHSERSSPSAQITNPNPMPVRRFAAGGLEIYSRARMGFPAGPTRYCFPA